MKTFLAFSRKSSFVQKALCLLSAVCIVLILSSTLYAEGWVYSPLAINSGYVKALACNSSGKPYAGGAFFATGGMDIAGWDGSTWSSLGPGTGGAVYAVATYGSNVYVGGQFSFTNDYVTEIERIGRWDGSSWNTLGSKGLDDDVYALVVDGTGNLYAGGAFTRDWDNTVTLNYIGKWDGASWSALSAGLNGAVRAIAFDGSGNLYAGGDFTKTSDLSVTLNHVAKWDGSSWSALGAGTDGVVNALAVNGGTLYAGGTFYSAGGVTVNNIAKWNGSSWNYLGSGFEFTVNALAVDGSGNLYAGGDFLEAWGGETPPVVNHIAKWDGSTWSGLGTGIGPETTSYTVFALAFDSLNNELYSGGYFFTTGGFPSYNIGIYSLSIPSEPATQASGINFTSVGTNSMTVNWTNGDGSKRLVLMKAVSAVDASPYDLTSYTADNIFGYGDQIGSGNFVIYNGSGNSVAVSNLAPGQIYHVAIYEYNGSAGAENYQYSGAAGSRSTLTTEPATQASVVNFASVGSIDVTVNWTSGDGAYRLVLIKAGSAVDADPVDGTTYTASGQFGSGSQIGSGNYVVYSGTDATVTVTDLMPETTYYFAVYEFNGTGGAENYKLSGATGSITTAAPPSAPQIEGFESGLSLLPWTTGGDGLWNTSTANYFSGTYAVQAPWLGDNQIAYLKVPIGYSSNGAVSFWYKVSSEAGHDYLKFYIDGVPQGSGWSGEIGWTFAKYSVGAGNHVFQWKYSTDGANYTGNNTGWIDDISFVYATPGSEPTTQTSSVNFTSVTAGSMTVNWSNGNGSNRIVIMKSGSPVDADPVDGLIYNENTKFGAGDQIGAGNHVVYSGTGSSVTVTGLRYDTEYYVAVYEFNGANGGENYLIPGAIGNSTTDKLCVCNGTPLTFTKADWADWTQPANQDQITSQVWLTRQNSKSLYNIKQETVPGAYPDGLSPVDTEWAYGSISDAASLTYQTWGQWNGWSPSTMVGKDAVVHLISDNIYLPIKFLSWTQGSGSGTPAGGGFSYIRGTCDTSPASEPGLQAASVTFSSISAASMTVNWTKGDGDKRIVLMKADSSVNIDPADLTPYTANSFFGLGTEIGTGNFVVYDGTGNFVNVKGLNPGTTYHVAVYEYNGCICGTQNYLVPGAVGNTVTNDLDICGCTEKPIIFTKADWADWTQSANQDRITPLIWLTRKNSQGLFNIEQESGFGASISPIDTEWAYGVIDNAKSLTYQTWNEWNGGNPPSMKNQDAVVHLISEDIYVPIRFLTWTQGSSGTPAGGGFSYIRGTCPAPVLSSEPTLQAASVTLSSVSATSMIVNWTKGNGDRRIVLMKAGSSVDSYPVDLTFYQAKSAFGSGTVIGTGNYAVYNGTGNSVQVTGLNPSTTYYVAVYEFNGCMSGTQNYLITGVSNTNSATTRALPSAPQSDSFESGDLTALPWLTVGNAYWSVVTTTALNGIYSAQAPTGLGDNQSSYLEVPISYSSSGGASFWYKVSSESGSDFLKFYIDGVQQASDWSGEIGWTFASYSVASGTHTFRWEYSKNYSNSAGLDTAWIDKISFDSSISAPSVITWNTFMGSNVIDPDLGYGIAVDGSGNVYMTGQSAGSWGSPIRGFSGRFDAFAVKLNSSGGRVWNTFFGTSNYDFGRAIAVDGSGNVYVGGQSETSWGSPISPNIGFSAFLVKLNSGGGIIWNTFMGSDATIYSITVDGGGNIYVAGDSNSSWGSPKRSYAGGADAFVAKLSSAGSLLWNTFLGESSNDRANGIAVDGSGNIYVTGSSQSTWGTPVNPYAGYYEAFAAKLNNSGDLQWNTFMGTAGYDDGSAIAVSSSGNIYVAGTSDATWGAPINSFTGSYDVFAAKLNNSGVLQWNTFMGSSYSDSAGGISVDSSDYVYVSGSSGAWGYPINPNNGSTNVFSAKLNSSGVLQWNTFIGGDGLGVMALDASGNVYLGGFSNNSWGSPVNAYSGNTDGFAAKLPPFPSKPTVQSSNLTFTPPGTTSVTVNWTGGNGDGRIALMKAGSAVDAPFGNWTNYTANSVFAAGDQIGAGNFLIYKGTGSSVNVTGLTPGTVYRL